MISFIPGQSTVRSALAVTVTGMAETLGGTGLGVRTTGFVWTATRGAGWDLHGEADNVRRQCGPLAEEDIELAHLVEALIDERFVWSKVVLVVEALIHPVLIKVWVGPKNITPSPWCV